MTQNRKEVEKEEEEEEKERKEKRDRRQMWGKEEWKEERRRWECRGKVEDQAASCAEVEGWRGGGAGEG